MSKKRLLSRAEVDVDVWEERDRLHIHIRDKKTGQRTIAEWWDDDARQMFEDGFFKRGVELKRSVIAYAEEMGLLSTVGRNPAVRKNIFLFNNPGNAQRVLAENFVKGANSGVASSLYIHGNRIYSYGPHFPIAQRNSDGTILIRHPSKKAPSKTTAGHISLVVNAARQVFSPDSIIYDTADELKGEAKGPAAYSNPGVRKNIFLFNNPRGLNTVEQAAAQVGLVVGTWAPGDGVTRYRFFLSDGKSRYGDYHQGDGLYTALGRKDAMAFISAYGKGRSARTNPKSSTMYVIEGFTHHGRRGHSQRRAEFRTSSFEEARARAEQIFKETGVVVAITKKNPLTKRETSTVVESARFHARMARSVTPGAPYRSHLLGVAEGQLNVAAQYGRGKNRGRAGTMVSAVDRMAMAKGGPYMRFSHKPIHRNPAACPNPCVRGDKLPYHLQQEVLRKYIYRWTTGNTQRDSAYRGLGTPKIPLISDTQWLREHAFHVTKAGKLDLRHHHAEPHYMADDWKKGDPRPNPLLQTVFAANPPTSADALKRQMVSFLKKQFRGLIDVDSADTNFNIEGAIYWFANDYHGGGGSQLYSILSTSKFRPGPSVRGPEPETEQMMYEALEQKYGGKKNPPISAQWDRMTMSQRCQLLRFVGYPDNFVASYAKFPWVTLNASAKRALERQWNDTGGGQRAGTTTRRRRLGVSVGAANPLTRTESGQILRDARFDVRHGSTFQGGHTRSSRAGMAFAKAKVVRQYGPKSARHAANRISDKARTVARTTMSNPGGLRLPAPGTKMTVAQAMDLARRVGDRELIQQCQQAAKLQKASDRNTKCVVWKHLPLGSKNKIDAVVAMTHYGTSPEDMYKPPSGSKKGNHMYRHRWKKSVSVLASPSGKAIIKVMGPGQKVGDWMRG